MHRLAVLLSFLLSTAVFSYFLGPLLWQPNQKAPTFGGDGLTIHYNLSYHATYGQGPYLEAQYHPHRESIFMTDAQGMVAVILAGLRPVFPKIGDYAVGISNVLTFWSNPLAAALLCALLLGFGVAPLPAVLLGVLMSMMAPQIERQLTGHYALGFAFLLPLLMLFVQRGRGLGWGVLTFSTLVLLGLNNPYLILIGVAFLLATAAVAAAARAVAWRRILLWTGVALGSLLVVFLVLRGLDPADDRVEVPFGFFKNISSWAGLVNSPYLPWHDALQDLLHLPDVRGEAKSYLGLVPFLGTILILLAAPFRRPVGLRGRPLVWCLFGGGVLCLLFSFALPFQWFIPFSYDHFGAVLQFRAPGRFAWPLFYGVGVLVGCGVFSRPTKPCGRFGGRRGTQGFGGRRGTQGFGGRLKRILPALLLTLWAADALPFLHHAAQGRINGNILRPERRQEMATLAERYGIDTATYQGIYLLPTEIAWTDKVHHAGSWRSNVEGYQMSLATGLPLINGKLSRMSLADNLAALQLVSDPGIERILLEELDPERRILLLASAENGLHPYERQLLSLGTPLHADERRILRSVTVPTIAAATGGNHPDSLTVLSLPEGERTIAAGHRTHFLDQRIEGISADSAQFRLWTYADPSLYASPKFFLVLSDPTTDSVFYRTDASALDAYTTREGWLRIDLPLPAPSPPARLQLFGEHHAPYQVRPAWRSE